MQWTRMMRGARTLVQTCARVKPGENVVVVCDHPLLGIAEVIAAAAHEVGADVVIAIMTPRGVDASEPPASVAEAMKAADVIFTPVSVSITHSDAVHQACAQGARVVALSAFTERMMIAGGIEADFQRLKPIVEKVAQAFTGASTLRLTTPGGTNLTLSIEGRVGVAKTCIVGPGEFSPVPDLEAAVAPVEGTAEGVVVADASIPYLGIGVLSHPVRFEVRGGRIVSAEGGEPAARLLRAWKDQQDPNVYNVAEIGIGLNPRARLTGEMLEDEGSWGTVHVGTGTNVTLGGAVRAASHYDLLMYRATIELDGRAILREGQLVGFEEDLREAGLV